MAKTTVFNKTRLFLNVRNVHFYKIYKNKF